MTGYLLAAGFCLATLLPPPPATMPAPPAAAPQEVPDAADAEPSVVVLHLPGIAGRMPVDQTFLTGLLAGGYANALYLLDWTGPNRGLPALGNVQVHQAATKQAVEKILELRRLHPEARLVLTGHSAGSGIAVFALESLPADVRIDQLVLLAPALSPGYDLSDALARVEGNAYVFLSEYDKVVLGAGTRLFGTVDRVNTDAAGLVGFDVPPERAQAYKRLVQVPYVAAYLRLNNLGDHIGCMSFDFTRQFIAPLLKTGQAPPVPERPAHQRPVHQRPVHQPATK